MKYKVTISFEITTPVVETENNIREAVEQMMDCDADWPDTYEIKVDLAG